MIEAIQDRLRATMPGLRTIAGLTQYAALKANPPLEKRPAVYVLALEDTARPNSMASGVHRQQVSCSISIVILFSDLSDSRGEGALKSIEQLYRQMRGALVGWSPPVPAEPASGPRIVAHEAISFVRGRLLDANDPIAWEERYLLPATLSSL
jgi:hypothetical protein